MIRWHALVTHLYCNEDGHRYGYHLAFREAILSIGLNYIGYTNKERQIKTIPSDWEECLHWKEEKSVRELLYRLRAFVSIFRRKSLPDEKRYFFLESYSLCDVVALAIAALFFKQSDKLFFVMRFDLESNYIKKSKGVLFLTLFKSLKWILKKRLVVLADTCRIQDSIAKQLKKPVLVIPILHTKDIPLGSVQKPPKIINLWWVGAPKQERGPEFIRKLCAAKTSSTFRLFVSEAFQLEASIEVVFLKKVLSRKEYLDQLMRSNVVLLPYDPVAYYSRSSGPFVEAVFAGKMPVVRDGSWLANELREHNLEELIVDFESLDEIAALAQDETVLKKLAKMQKHYREYHTVENFAQVLMRYEIANSRESKSSKDGQSAHPHAI